MRHALKVIIKGPLCSIERQLYLGKILSTDQLTLPNFLGLGSAQSGTSWLHKNLSQHTDAFLPDSKELHYFSRNFHTCTLRQYSHLFSEGRSVVRGEICPGYNLLWNKRIQYISRIMPDVRLFLIIRNPIDRAWSSARLIMSLFAKRRGTTFGALEDEEFYRFFVAERTYLSAQKRDSAFISGMLQSHYCRAIDNWQQYFPNEQLLVLFFDELVSSPELFLRRVCEHIGVRMNFEGDLKTLRVPVNKNPAHVIRPQYREFLQDFYKDEIEELARRYGEPALTWLRNYS